MPGAFGNDYGGIGSYDTSGKRYGGVQESTSPGERVKLATVGGTGSDQTGWKFANGAMSAGLAYVVAAASSSSSAPHDPESALEDIGDLVADQRLAMAEVNEAFNSGALNTNRTFGTLDAAAKEVLSVIGPISSRHNVELSGFISIAEGGFFYGQIYTGTRGSSPALQNVPLGAVGGFHTHPSNVAYFSLGDTQWVNGTHGTRIPLYVIGGGQIRTCGVSSATCNPISALGAAIDENNRGVRGRVIE